MTVIDVGGQDAVTAHVGDTVVIRLSETPSTGFTWTIDISGSAVSVAADTAAGNADPRPGAAGERTFVLDARAPGPAQVTLNLARPWDSGSPDQTRHIDVTVQD